MSKTLSFKTYSAKPGEVERTWYVIDAENQVLGRMAAQIANTLRGKHKPQFTPHIDTGDFVVVTNAGNVLSFLSPRVEPPRPDRARPESWGAQR